MEAFTKNELASIGIELFSYTTLDFASGVSLRGRVRAILDGGDKLQIITFDHCTVKGPDKALLFDPSFGEYDMAVGSSIVSVFSGAADKVAFEENLTQSPKASPIKKIDSGTKELNCLYQGVRNIRQETATQLNLQQVWEKLRNNYPNDWLCALEILEILELEDTQPYFIFEVREFLEEKAKTETGLKS